MARGLSHPFLVRPTRACHRKGRYVQSDSQLNLPTNYLMHKETRERETSSSLADLLHLDELDLHGDHPLRPPDRTQLSDAAKFGAAEQVSV